ncbi:MAG: dihydroorotate dehydrogenase electron transfer subunit [Candidatus Zixiibacteriota bacterium]
MSRPRCLPATISKIRDLKNDYYAITAGPFAPARSCRPGQFVHVLLPGTQIYFRRAFSIAAVDNQDKSIELIFKAIGQGTRSMSRLRKGDSIDILGPLGRPFGLPRKKDRTVIVAGGVGFPPLLFLATEMVRRGYDPEQVEFFYGGRRAHDLIECRRIKKLGVRFHPTTQDGSLGQRGLVTKPLVQLLDQHEGSPIRLYACGPEPMLKAVNNIGVERGLPGQLALEAPMPCGIGICLGCVVPLANGGHARVCCDGPVFNIGEVLL